MQYFVFTHDDLDAKVSVVLLRAAKLNINKVVYGNYTTIDDALVKFIKEKKFKPDDILLIVDICPSKEICEKLDEIAGKEIKVVLLDHHKTKKWIKKYPWVIYQEKNAAVIMILDWLTDQSLNIWLPCQDESYRNFAKAVDAWDLWKLQSEYRQRGVRLNTLQKFIGTKEFVKTFAENPNADLEGTYAVLISLLEKNKERYVKKIIKEQLQKARYYMDGFGKTFKILFATDYISEVGHAALNDNDSEDLHYIVVINPLYGSCSLRSRKGETDVSKIASMLSGGGHTNAAGFPLHIKDMIERIIFDKLNKLNY